MMRASGTVSPRACPRPSFSSGSLAVDFASFPPLQQARAAPCCSNRASRAAVIPAKAGIHPFLDRLDPRLRGSDSERYSSKGDVGTVCEPPLHDPGPCLRGNERCFGRRPVPNDTDILAP
jgi:hypothetical protein